MRRVFEALVTAAGVLLVLATMAVAFALATGVVRAANASTVLAECGASSGHSYYLPGPYVPDNKAGWSEDGITNGSIRLVLFTDEDGAPGVDIVYRAAGASGGSFIAEGFMPVLLAREPHPLVLMVHAAGVVETYLFEMDANGQARRVVWTRTTSGTQPIAKVSLMVADCTTPD